MGTRALAVLLLVPSFALAQAGTVTIKDTEFSRTECPGTTSLDVTFTINLSGTFTANSDEYRLFAQTGSCGSALPSTTLLAKKTAADTTTQILTTTANAIRTALVPNPACDGVDDVSYYLCVYLVNVSGTVVGTASGGNQKFQLAVPPAPVITNVAPGDKALEVTVVKGTTTANEKADTAITFQVVASASGFPTVTEPDPPTSSGTIRVEGLANNVPYTVEAYAFSSAGNKSTAATASGMPLPFDDFWEAYQNAGGREQGGCGGGAGALSLLTLLPLALRLRRRRS